jgi:hypothetical protein
VNTLDLLATTTNTHAATPAAPLLIAYIIWCFRRDPSPGSTRALDGWAGFFSANFIVVGFWMKRRWALGFLWLAIFAVAVCIQWTIAINFPFETREAANTFESVSVICLVLLGWTAGIVAMQTSRIWHGSAPAVSREQSRSDANRG